MIFREFYPRGLTALDDLDETTLGTRPTMSHVTARQEVENLLAAMGLGEATDDRTSRGRQARRGLNSSPQAAGSIGTSRRAKSGGSLAFAACVKNCVLTMAYPNINNFLRSP